MTTTASRHPASAEDSALAPELLIVIHEAMVRARCLEERLIRMNKQGDGFFWVGGPGEEALNASLGLLVHKGQGPAYDYLHLHYRSTATLLAMGADPADTLRQMKNTATDPYSAGRNFTNHYSVRRWNVVPVSSPHRGSSSRWLRGTALANKPRRRQRHHDRARWRCRHPRRGLLDLPRVVLAARARASVPDDRRQ